MKIIEDDIFHLEDQHEMPQEGELLLAQPTMMDPHFVQTVILMIQQNEKGAMGIIVNQLLGADITDLVKDMVTIAPIPVYAGGPVDPSVLFYLHTLGPDVITDAVEIRPGLWLGGEFDDVRDYLMTHDAEGKIKFIVGYSGWDPNQLAGEVDMHGWATLTDCPADLLMAKSEGDMWRQCIARLGPRYSAWLNWPRDPNDN